MVLLKSVQPKEFEYTTVLCHSKLALCFLGTSKGSVEVWDLSRLEILAVIRHVTVDEYGDPVPIEEPVVTLAAPHNFEVVYALFGTGAYCIDVKLLTIIQEVPITEKVICGSIGQYTGDISVLSETGYLSRWSAKFVERTGSFDFPFYLKQGYLLHDYDEARVILILQEDKLILVNLENEYYTIEFSLPGVSQFLNNITYDCNENFQIQIMNDFSVEFHDNKSNLNITANIFHNGKIMAENFVRDFISSQDTSEEQRNYITDFRLLRQSRDRYTAEVER